MYTQFDEITVDPINQLQVIDAYNHGYVFTRKAEGLMQQVRSIRINLADFLLSSENRRILKKFSSKISLDPIPYQNYSWQIHALGKAFYEQKFGEKSFSANKIKELFTKGVNFNNILSFYDEDLHTTNTKGYAICYTSTQPSKILHYAYPFYDLSLINTNFGMYMMTQTVMFASEQGYEYVYLGSAHTPSALYKIQFKGVEWWDEQKQIWSNDISLLKERLQTKV